jgi:uncharacterized protein YcgI (DUF1989 family)
VKLLAVELLGAWCKRLRVSTLVTAYTVRNRRRSLEVEVMMGESKLLLRAGQGLAVEVSAGHQVRVVNRAGGQVVDMWAVNPADPAERLSMEHTRTSLSKLVPAVGDRLYSCRRRPMLTLVQDTTAGVHDTLIAACDSARYRQLGGAADHANCADNLRRALATRGIEIDGTPAPLNLFMHIPWQPDGRLEFLPSPARAGDHVTFSALIDVVVVLSACPMDLNPINPRLGDIDVELT